MMQNTLEFLPVPILLDILQIKSQRVALLAGLHRPMQNRIAVLIVQFIF